MSGKARKAGLHLTPRDVFRRRTVAALAAVTNASATPTAPAERDSGVGTIAATPMLAETADAQTPLANFYQSTVLATPAGITGSQMELVLQAHARHPRHAACAPRRGRRRLDAFGAAGAGVGRFGADLSGTAFSPHPTSRRPPTPRPPNSTPRTVG